MRLRSAIVPSLLGALLAAAGCGSSSSSGAAFPGGKTIQIIRWSAAGSPKDVMARQVAKALQKQHQWKAVVTDITGGDGAEAMHYLLSRPADGLTLIAAAGSMDVSLQTDLKSSFKVSDFDFVSEIQTDPFVLIVPSSSKYSTMKDFAAAAGASPLTVGGFGTDSSEHLVAAELAQQGRFKITWVPYSGGSQAITAALTNLSAVIPLAQAGKVHILGVTAAKSLEQPPAPSFESMGYKDMVSSLWRGIIARAGTPPSDMATLSQALADLAKDPDYMSYVKSIHIEVSYLGPQEFNREVLADVKQAGANLDLLKT